MTTVAERLTVRVTVEIRQEAEVDVVGLIRQYLAEYKALELKGYEPWERPAVFISEYVAELTGSDFGPDDGKHVRDKSYSVDPEVDFCWTREQWEALLEEFPEADPEFVPDPWAAARVPGPLDRMLPPEIVGEVES